MSVHATQRWLEQPVTMLISRRWNPTLKWLQLYPSSPPFFPFPFPQSHSPLSVTESSCCVYYMVPLGPWWLHHKPQHCPQSRGPRCPGSLCCSEPSWPPGWRTGPDPKDPPGTILQPKPGMNQTPHLGNPGAKEVLLDRWQRGGLTKEHGDRRANTLLLPYTHRLRFSCFSALGKTADLLLGRLRRCGKKWPVCVQDSETKEPYWRGSFVSRWGSPRLLLLLPITISFLLPRAAHTHAHTPHSPTTSTLNTLANIML